MGSRITFSLGKLMLSTWQQLVFLELEMPGSGREC